jgi:hypothetical protein
MELTAAIMALEALTRPCDIDLYTDSQYVRGGIMGWLKGWKKNGWRTADKKPVKNVELWQRLDEAAQRHNVEWHWVKGHNGHDMNERADALARFGMEPFKTRTRKTAPGANGGSFILRASWFAHVLLPLNRRVHPRPGPTGEGCEASDDEQDYDKQAVKTHEPIDCRSQIFHWRSRNFPIR